MTLSLIFPVFPVIRKQHMANSENEGIGRRDFLRGGRGRENKQDAPSQPTQESLQPPDIADLIINGNTNRRGFLGTVGAWLLTPNLPLPAAARPYEVRNRRDSLSMHCKTQLFLRYLPCSAILKCMTGLLIGAVKPATVLNEALGSNISTDSLDNVLKVRSAATSHKICYGTANKSGNA